MHAVLRHPAPFCVGVILQNYRKNAAIIRLRHVNIDSLPVKITDPMGQETGESARFAVHIARIFPGPVRNQADLRCDQKNSRLDRLIGHDLNRILEAAALFSGADLRF